MLKSKRVVAFLLAVMIVVSYNLTDSYASSKKVKLNTTNVVLSVNAHFKLRVKNAKKKKIKWSSSNRKVASVDKKGVVYALNPGKTVIKAKVKRKILKCSVRVVNDNDKVTSITSTTSVILNPNTPQEHRGLIKNYILSKGVKNAEGVVEADVNVPLKGSVVPFLEYNPTDNRIEWGTTRMIQAQGYSMKTVTSVSFDEEGNADLVWSDFTYNSSNALVHMGMATYYDIKLSQIGKNRTYPWSVKLNSGSNGCKFSDGEIKQLADESANVMLTDFEIFIIFSELNTSMDSLGFSNLKAKATTQAPPATTEAKPIRTTSITLNKTSESITEGETITLLATKTPVESVDGIEWSSSDESIATVWDGVVVGKKSGQAVIKVKSGYYAAECTITVMKKYPKVMNIVQKSNSEITVTFDFISEDVTNKDSFVIKSADGSVDIPVSKITASGDGRTADLLLGRVLDKDREYIVKYMSTESSFIATMPVVVSRIKIRHTAVIKDRKKDFSYSLYDSNDIMIDTLEYSKNVTIEVSDEIEAHLDGRWPYFIMREIGAEGMITIRYNNGDFEDAVATQKVVCTKNLDAG